MCFMFQITTYLFKTNGVVGTVSNVTFSDGCITTAFNLVTASIVSSTTIADASTQAVPYVIPESTSVIAIKGWLDRLLE